MLIKIYLNMVKSEKKTLKKTHTVNSHNSCIGKTGKVVWVLSINHLRIWINTVFRYSCDR